MVSEELKEFKKELDEARKIEKKTSKEMDKVALQIIKERKEKSGYREEGIYLKTKKAPSEQKKDKMIYYSCSAS